MRLRKRQGLAVLCMSLALAGCSKPTVDASSDEKFQQSLQDVRDSLSDADKEKFNESIKTIIGEQVRNTIKDHVSNGKGLMGLASIDENEFKSQAESTLSGMNGQQIIEKGQDLIREQGKRDLKNLQEKADRAAHDKGEIEKIQVLNSSFRLVPDGYSRYPEPVIDISVKNDSSQPLSKISFQGIVKSVDRTVPWIDETFSYEIPGGLEPGETAKWQLAPNKFSVWGETKVPSDAVMVTTVKSVYGADGKVLWDVTGLSDKEKDRLKSLQEEFGDK